MNRIKTAAFCFIITVCVTSLPLHGMQNCDLHANFKPQAPETTYLLPSEDQIKERFASPEFGPLLECSDLLADLADQSLDVSSILWQLHLLIAQVPSTAATKKEWAVLNIFYTLYRENISRIAANLLADYPEAQPELARLAAEEKGQLFVGH